MAYKKKGIDVSYHQGTIDWEKVSKQIDFAILRAGYGKNNIDKQFDRNALMCEKYNIPYGIYWFSYAKNADEARAEAEYCLNAIRDKKPTYPIVFDFEYDSEKYITLTKANRIIIAQTFLDAVEKAGYYAMIYTNVDYLNKGFSELTSRYDLWLAQWRDTEKPSISCGIWQYSSSGKIDGINGSVDLDISFKNYPSIIKKTQTTLEVKPTVKERLQKLADELAEIIRGI